jgi:antitoxin CcdA
MYDAHARCEMGAKRAVNLSVDGDVLDEARRHGTNLSAVLEQALVAANEKARREAWRAANRDAIKAANEELAERGLWSDGLRVL